MKDYQRVLEVYGCDECDGARDLFDAARNGCEKHLMKYID